MGVQKVHKEVYKDSQIKVKQEALTPLRCPLVHEQASAPERQRGWLVLAQASW